MSMKETEQWRVCYLSLHEEIYIVDSDFREEMAAENMERVEKMVIVHLVFNQAALRHA